MVWTLVAVAAATFAVGFVTGFYTAGTLERTSTEDMRLYISALIAVMWAISVAAGIIITDYSPSLALHGIMGAAAGYFFKTGNPVSNLVGGGDSSTEGEGDE